MFHLLITLALAPILLIQGKLVRRNMIELPEPFGARKGTTGTGEDLHVLILGDSAAAGVGVGHQDDALTGRLIKNLSGDFCLSWQLEASTGLTTKQSLNRLDKLKTKQFDVVITSLGVNDVTSNLSLSKWLKQQDFLQEKCVQKHNAKLVIVTSLPPVEKFPALPQPLRWYLGRRAKQFNRVLEKQISNQDYVEYLSIGMLEDLNSMAKDGFHPGKEVYQQWAIKAADKIKTKF